MSHGRYWELTLSPPRRDMLGVVRTPDGYIEAPVVSDERAPQTCKCSVLEEMEGHLQLGVSAYASKT